MTTQKLCHKKICKLTYKIISMLCGKLLLASCIEILEILRFFMTTNGHIMLENRLTYRSNKKGCV